MPKTGTDRGNFGAPAACHGKAPMSAHQAYRAAARARKRRHGERINYQPYRCPICGRWHLSSIHVED